MRRGILGWIGPPEGAPRLAEAARVRGLQRMNGWPGFELYVGADLTVASANSEIIIGERFEQTRGCSTGWGNFLAFAPGIRGLVTITRASVTGLPLYWSRGIGGTLIFSHLELGAAAGLRLAIDWAFVAHSLAYRNRRAERTGIDKVFELLPGTRLRSAGEEHYVDTSWLPWPFAAHARQGAPDLDPALIRDTSIDCVDLWAGDRKDILLELSGGLDSSIVAACLKAAGRPFRAVTVATTSADGDERRFARDVAVLTECPLEEKRHAMTEIDLAKLPAALTPRPAAQNILRGFDRAIAAASFGPAVSLWSGIGGDNVFHYSNSIAPALDVWRRYGTGPRLARTIGDIARVTGTHWWHVARHVWRRGRTPRLRKQDWPRDDCFAHAGALPEAPFEHPWAAGGEGASSGARQHVEALLRISDFLDRPERWHDRDVVTPLLSQPLVEICLAVPSWRWIEGGRDRSAAREAFARELPPSVATRRTKGRLQTMCAEAYLRDRALLGPLLLDGRLAAAGLIDRAAIAAHLARTSVDEDFAYFRLMEIADLELWIRAVDAAR
jgi:asparagine synthase (glutamine-hydrolysing)